MNLSPRTLLVAALFMGCGDPAPAAMDAAARADLVADAADVSVTDDLDGASEAGADAGAPDASDEDADASSGDGGLTLGVRADRPAGCPTTVAVRDSYHWAPPHVRPNACSAQQIEALRSGIEAGWPYSDRRYVTALGAACHACVFSNQETDKTWGAIMVSTPSNPTEYLNVGGCMLAAGVSEACGRAAHVYPRCAYAACDGCDLPDVEACVYSPRVYAAGGPCADVRTAYRLACRDTMQAYARCYGPDGIALPEWAALVAGVLCGPAPDGGM